MTSIDNGSASIPSAEVMEMLESLVAKVDNLTAKVDDMKAQSEKQNATLQEVKKNVGTLNTRVEKIEAATLQGKS